MPRVLYFRLGNKDEISLKDLAAALKHIIGVLEDLDAALSRDPRGTVRWKVAVLQKSSPALLGVVGEPIRRRRQQVLSDNSARVESELITGIVELSGANRRPDTLSDAALNRVRRLAAQSKRLGAIQVYTDGKQAPIDESTLEGIQKITGSRSKSVGSVLGRLDTIAVHRNTEIRVWDENGNRPIRCWYPIALEETVKSLLRERVLVTGVVSYNPNGQPVSVEVTGIERYPSESELPTIEEMSGLLQDATGGMPLAAYLEHIRDG
jgi:hypothetical protein